MTSIDLDPTSTPLRAGNRATNVARLLQSLGTDPDLVAGITVTDAHRARRQPVRGEDRLRPPPGCLRRRPVRARARRGTRRRAAERTPRPKPPAAQRPRHQEAQRRLRAAARRLGAARRRLPAVGRKAGARRTAPGPVRARVRVRSSRHRGGRAALGTTRDRLVRRPLYAALASAAYGENLTSVDAFSWVPRGYAVVRVDERGTGGTRGPLQPFSRQEALDYYDVIEWVAAQDWCTGAVGPRRRVIRGDDPVERGAAPPTEPAGHDPVGERHRLVPRARLPRWHPPRGLPQLVVGLGHTEHHAGRGRAGLRPGAARAPLVRRKLLRSRRRRPDHRRARRDRPAVPDCGQPERDAPRPRRF